MIKVGYVDFEGYKTYYRIVGSEFNKTPLLILHGGPGSTHNSYEALDPIASLDKRPIIMYDQFGCGNSSFDDLHKEKYNASTWVKELINLREKLNLTKVHLLGHSWGGMLAIIYMIDYKPKGIESLILSSTLSSSKIWKEETMSLLRYLSDEEQKSIAACLKNRDYDNPEFKKAYEHYSTLFIGTKASESPFEFIKRKKNFGKVAYNEAWGPVEFMPLGNLKDYDYTDRLKEIKVPVLINSGSFDESTPLINKTIYDNLETYKRWTIISKARHTTYLDNYKEYSKSIVSFMNLVDDKLF